jgi:hypothetical protein
MNAAITPTGHTARKESNMDFTLVSITYEEACANAERNFKATNGMVVGGTYMVRFPSGIVREVELRISATGMARPA